MSRLSRTSQLLASALAALVLSACGHNALSPNGAYNTGYGQPASQGYGQTYDQGYGTQPYGQADGQGFYTQAPTQGNGAYPTGSDPSGGYGWQSETGGSDPYLPQGQYPGQTAQPGQDSNAYPGSYPYPDQNSAPTAPYPSPTPGDRAPAPAVLTQVSEDLSVLTYNVWGLPSLLGTQRKERFSRMGATFSAYDVVLLQETFSDDIDMVKQGSGFAYSYRHDNSSLINAGSGLTVLSKYPIMTTDYQAFNQCAGKDCLVKKGILMARINHPKLGPVDVYTTHYHSGDTAKAKNLRTEDANRLLQEFIQSHRSAYPVILAGDFNFTPDLEEYQNLLGRLPLKDVFKTLHPNDPGYTIDPGNPHLEGEGQSMRSDYIFTLDKPEISITPISAAVTHKDAVDGFVLSDQYGVGAKMKIKLKRQVN